jgi:hypothetical protein
LAGLARNARAQTVTLDEGTFRITIGGREAGTETFSIRQNGSGAGAVIIARGRVNLDAQETTASAQLSGETLRVTAYEITTSGPEGQKIAGNTVRGRFSARIVSSAGENMREYLVSEDAVLLDEGIAHHYYFLSKRAGTGAGRLPLLVPRDSRQVIASITAGSEEAIQIGGKTLDSRRFTVQPAGGTERTVWVDAQGRVLRVSVPARQYVAERTAPPA